MLTESRIHELEKVKSQFIELLNSPIYKSHFLKRKELTFALYQTFYQQYGYLDKNNKPTFSKKYPELFNFELFNKWFHEWREFAIQNSWKDAPKFPYNESLKYLKSFNKF